MISLMAEREPTVTIEEGCLRGTFGKNLDGETFYKFLGIPYGKPPINELRFKPPQPAEPWTGVRDASIVGNSSISRDEITGKLVGSEDCLYLNVYLKNLPVPGAKPKPVMVFIHGGGLTTGSSRPGNYGPEFLMTKDIILVTLNYRLGILGFLAFDDVSLGVTGNMGLKDQTLALKWVQKNIAAFNGDPNDVTIFGQSAGGSSVHAHILSPLSKGLFHKAILQSGCALNSWFWGSKNNAREIISHIGKSATTEKEALDVLKGLSGLEIFEAQENMFDIPYPAYTRNFSAVVETPNDAAFFVKTPVEIMRDGSFNKVPIMVGYTKTEGMLLEQDILAAEQSGNQVPDFNLEDAIPYQLNVSMGSNESREICDALNEIYMNCDDCLYDKLTDGYFLVGIVETIKSIIRTSTYPIYMYRMTLEGSLNYLKNLLNNLDKPGVSHGDDLGYLFHSEITPEIKPGSLEEKSVRAFVELWTNFAVHGNPTPDDKLNVLWEPLKGEESIRVLEIGEKLEFKDIPEGNRLKGWQDILKKYPIKRFD